MKKERVQELRLLVRKKEILIIIATIGILLVLVGMPEKPSVVSYVSAGVAIVVLGGCIYLQTRSFANWLKILKGLIDY